jgi:secondary thiamine-phosphate synthase enzyme
MKIINLETAKKNELVNLTEQIRDFVARSGVREGICLINCPHTSAGLTINSVADPLSGDDLLDTLDQVAPQRRAWKHHGSPPDADAHVKTSVVGSFLALPISNSELMYGKYQSILFCEFDGPRKRQVYITIQS